MTITDDRSTTCPAWCRADHEADERRRRESVQATVRLLAADGLHVEPVLDTFRVHTVRVQHTVEVGHMPVRTARGERPVPLRVTWSRSRTSYSAADHTEGAG